MQSVPITTEVVRSNPPRLGFSAQRLCDKVSKWLAAGRWFYRGFIQFPPPIKGQPRYNWNIVESGVIQHNTKPPSFT